MGGLELVSVLWNNAGSGIRLVLDVSWLPDETERKHPVRFIEPHVVGDGAQLGGVYLLAWIRR